MDKTPVIVEQLIGSPVAAVWKAITDHQAMKKWYFNLETFRAAVGFTFQFSGGPQNGIVYQHLCEITTVIPNKRLAYTWRYDGYPGNTTVQFDLTAVDDKTLLKLTHTGLESFPEQNPDFAKENFKAGWSQIIQVSLKDYVESNQ